MDSFESAHVAKTTKKRPNKGKKSQDGVKKQFKQMLYGFKKNDTDIIKKSVPRECSAVDVSFSSNIDSDVSYLHISNHSNTSSLSRYSDNLEDKNTPLMQRKEFLSDETSDGLSNDSVIEDELIFKALEGDTSIDFDDIESTLATTSSEDSQPFDLDGTLATKILLNLEANDRVESLNKRQSVALNMTKAPVVKKKLKNKTKSSKIKNMNDKQMSIPKVNDYNDPHRMEGEPQIDFDCTEQYVDIYNSPRPRRIIKSPAYVSITAQTLPDEDIVDIVGDYSHPTFRNTSEISNAVLPNYPFWCKNDIETDANIEEPSVVDAITSNLHSNLSVNETTDVDETALSSDDLTSTKYDISLKDSDNSIFRDVSEAATEQLDYSSDTLDINHAESVQVLYLKTSCILVLKHPTELYVQGKVKVTRLAGTTEVFGYSLGSKTTEIYAPNYDNCFCLKTIQKNNDYYGLFSKLTSRGLSVTDTENVVTSLSDHDAVLHLEPLHNRTLDFVEEHFGITDLFSKIDRTVEPSLLKASTLLGCSLSLNRSYKCFKENPIWQQIFEIDHSQRKRGIVCGGKGIGKSSFLRYYVNKQLYYGPVLVIDLDPGQCEFTVAGNVSATLVQDPLLGPNFTHLRKPDRMLNVGMINVMDNVNRYMAAVSDLITYCNSKEEYREVPWIVNTMGMCNAIGLKLLTYIVLKLQTTFVLQMDLRVVKRKFECLINADTIKSLCIERYQHNKLFKSIMTLENLTYTFVVCLQDAVNSGKNTCLSPKDKRYLNLLAYFGDILKKHNQSGILGNVPYEVPLDKLQIAANIDIDETAVLHVINGKIVALCIELHSQSPRKVYTLKNQPLLCLGYGLIRGGDVGRGLLYCSTPLSQSEVTQVTTLGYSDWMPELDEERELPAGRHVPYRASPMHHHHQLMKTPRRRFNPLQLLKMARSS